MTPKTYFTNGVPELLLLRLLGAREMYGYELVNAIRTQSGEAFQFGEGCLYPILHRLNDEGHLLSRREVVEGRARHYYKASAKGRKHFARLSEEFRRVVRGAESVLEVSYAH